MLLARSLVRLGFSAFPGLLQGAGDALAWGAAGGVVGVQALGLVVVGVGWDGVAAQPVALESVDPGAQEAELVAADVVDAGAAVVRVAVGFYEPGDTEDRQVFADERLAGAEGAGKRCRGAWFVRERPHDPLAQLVAEEVEGRQLGGCGPAVGVAFLRSAAVMDLHGCVLPGSRLFMPGSAFSGDRVALGLFPKGGLVRPLCSEEGRTRTPTECATPCTAGRPRSTFFSLPVTAGRSAVARRPRKLICPQEG